jgi:D-hydroxyproline dehydrogenase subunit gamma
MRVSFMFDGQSVTGIEGQSVAAALLSAGVRHWRDAPDGSPRSGFCFMGLCQECLVEVDGVAIEACRLRVAPALRVDRR